MIAELCHAPSESQLGIQVIWRAMAEMATVQVNGEI
jgi:hypothetical protein